MMKLTNIYRLALASGVLSIGLAACQKTDTAAEDAPAQKGPAEKVGENLDKAAAEAAKHLGTMAEHAGKGIEKAAESLQKDPKDAQEKDAQSQETQK
jgi:hypothetical protein